MVAPLPVEGGRGIDQRQRCPRCGAEFSCGAANAARACACSALALTPQRLAAIRESWTGCLCGACLLALAGDDGGSVEPALAPGREPLKRG
jgi:hypothetical protein